MPVTKLVQSVTDLPTGPKILPKLMELLDDDQTTVEDVGDLIAFEPALTARLLKFCNSAYFGLAEPVYSVPEAIGMIGFQSLRPLVTAACGGQAFVLPAESQVDAGKLWRHSLLTAFACKFLAEDAKVNSDMLFTAGLLHDIGCIVLAKAKGAEYGRLLAKANSDQVPATVSENSAYGFSHAEVGACLLRKWQFPDLITDCVGFYPLPSKAFFPTAAACVYLGNALAGSLEKPPSDYHLPPDEMEQARQLLGISDKGMEIYAQRVLENMDFVEAMI